MKDAVIGIVVIIFSSYILFRYKYYGKKDGDFWKKNATFLFKGNEYYQFVYLAGSIFLIVLGVLILVGAILRWID